MQLTRRELIRTGVAGAALLALADCAHRPGAASDPEYRYRVLNDGDRVMLTAVGTALLAGALPSGTVEGTSPIVQVVRGIDIAVAGLPPGPQGEVRELFWLLTFAPTRAITAGMWHGWQDASTSDVARFLERWRFSGIELYRSGYQALHALAMAAWYGNDAAWARIGYPGPPTL